jgi:hypothetical protein
VLTEALGCVPLLDPTGGLRAGGPITYASVFAVVLWICAASIVAVRSELVAARTGHHQEQVYSQAPA